MRTISLFIRIVSMLNNRVKMSKYKDRRNVLREGKKYRSDRKTEVISTTRWQHYHTGELTGSQSRVDGDKCLYFHLFKHKKNQNV